MSEQEEYKEEKRKKGITTKRKHPVVHPVPYDLENKSRSKEAFLKHRAAMKAAKLKADEAYQSSLAESGISPAQAKSSDDLALAKDDVAKIKGEIQEVSEALKEKPDSKRLMTKLEKLQAKLTDAENALEELEK
jgi:hypothetical protein